MAATATTRHQRAEVQAIGASSQIRGIRRSGVHCAPMSRSLVERRLTEVGARLKQLRDELAVSDEQLGHLAEAADDARLRSLVSETPLADREHQDAQRHADAMQRHRADVVEQISRLEQTQDELLDRLMAETRS